MMITELMISKSHKKGGGKRIPQTKTSLPVSQWFVSLHSWIPAQWLQTNSLPFGNVHLISTHKFSLSSLTTSKSEFISRPDLYLIPTIKVYDGTNFELVKAKSRKRMFFERWNSSKRGIRASENLTKI